MRYVDVLVNAVAVQVETVDHKVGQEDDMLEAVELLAGLAGTGGWGREDGGWRMEDGGWSMEDGGRRVEDGGWGMMVVVARVFVAEDLDTSSIL